MQIGHEIECTDEESEWNGQGEVDDEESDAEQHTHTHGDDGLSTEIAVHALLEVGHHTLHDVASAFGHEFEKPFCHLFVVHEDKEQVDDGDERGDEAHDGAHATAHDGEELRNLLLHKL